MIPDFQAIAARLALPAFEGSTDWLYLDADDPPNPTCGVGHLVRTVEDCLAIPWQFEGQEATPSRVREDFQALLFAAKGHSAGYYGAETQIRLPAGWSIQDCAAELASKYWPMVLNDFPGANNYPGPAQDALADLCWNAGDLKAWSHLRVACEVGAWRDAASGCHRKPPVSAARNQWTAQQFMGCVV